MSAAKNTKRPILKKPKFLKPLAKSANYKSTELIQPSDDEVAPLGNGDGSKEFLNGIKSKPKTPLSSRSQERSYAVNNARLKPTTPVLAQNKNDVSDLENNISNSSEIDSHSERDEIEGSGGSDQSGTEHGLDQENEKKGKNVTNHHEGTQKQSLQRPVHLHELPSGFELATFDISPSSNLKNLILPSSLSGKHVWHITAPSSVPISAIQEISAQKISDGDVVLSHEGTDYGLLAEPHPTETNEILLLPSPISNSYENMNIKIARTFQLRQLIHPPNATNRINSLTNKSLSGYAKPIRQQPEGLRMRYRPFGDCSDPSEESSQDTSSKPEPQAHQFRVPPVLKTPVKVKKRKRDNDESHDLHQSNETPTKSSKKSRTEQAKKPNSTTTTPQTPKNAKSSKKHPQTHPAEPLQSPTKLPQTPSPLKSTPHRDPLPLTTEQPNTTPTPTGPTPNPHIPKPHPPSNNPPHPTKKHKPPKSARSPPPETPNSPPVPQDHSKDPGPRPDKSGFFSGTLTLKVREGEGKDEGDCVGVDGSVRGGKKEGREGKRKRGEGEGVKRKKGGGK